MTEDEAYLRYQKFRDVTFPAVDKADWPKYFRDLIPLEHGLVFGGAIGYCPDHPLSMHIEDDTPIRAKPIQYARPERRWINEYVRTQIKLGVMREV